MLNADYIRQLGIESIINYLRKSRQDIEFEKRTGEDTLKSQTDLMNTILAPLGVYYEQKSEIGSGDKISTRPVFQEIIEDLREGKYQAIAVKEITRMGRGSYTDMGTIYDLLVEKRIFIVTPWRVYDPKNNSDLKQLRFELFMSREEFETTRERLAGGRNTRSLLGQWMAGKAPFGYQIDPVTKKLVIDEEESRRVQIIFDLFTNGIPEPFSSSKRLVRGRALGTYLKQIGVLTPAGKVNWRSSTLEYILGNDVYIGTVRYRQTQVVDGRTVPRPDEEHIVVHNAHPPIIERETFDRAVILLANVDQKHVVPVRNEFIPYELAGLMICKVCGKRLIRQSGKSPYKKKNGETVYYDKEFLWCPTPACTNLKYQSVLEDVVEVLRYFNRLNADDHILEEQIKAVMLKKSAPEKTHEEDIALYVERRRKELKNKMKFILSKHESGIYDDELFLEQKHEIDKELSQLQEMAKPKEEQHEDNDSIDINLVKQHITTILDAYNACTESNKKNELLRRIFDHIIVERTEKGRGSTPSKFVLYPVLKHNFFI